MASPLAHGIQEPRPIESGMINAREEDEIAAALRATLGHRTYRQIGRDTGIHPESVRRYFRGKSRIPASFIAVISATYDIRPDSLLMKKQPSSATAAAVHGRDSDN